MDNQELSAPGVLHTRLKKALRIEWLGQTTASLCWMTSMMFYGLNAPGDWLQLSAASAWFMANMAALVKVEEV